MTISGFPTRVTVYVKFKQHKYVLIWSNKDETFPGWVQRLRTVTFFIVFINNASLCANHIISQSALTTTSRRVDSIIMKEQ